MKWLAIILVALLIVAVRLLSRSCKLLERYKSLVLSYEEQIENQTKLIHTLEGQLSIRRRLLDVQNGRIKELEAQLKAAKAGDGLAERMEDDGK